MEDESAIKEAEKAYEYLKKQPWREATLKGWPQNFVKVILTEIQMLSAMARCLVLSP